MAQVLEPPAQHQPQFREFEGPCKLKTSVLLFQVLSKTYRIDSTTYSKSREGISLFSTIIS
jgi:hypothetical protein